MAPMPTEDHDSSRRGARRVRPTRLGEAYERLAAADAPERSTPRTSSGWRSPPTCSAGPTSSPRPGQRAHLEAVRDGDVGLALRVRVRHRGWRSCSAARWRRPAAGSPARPARRGDRLRRRRARATCSIPQALQASMDGDAGDRVRDLRAGRRHRRAVRRRRPRDDRPARSRPVADRHGRDRARRRAPRRGDDSP